MVALPPVLVVVRVFLLLVVVWVELRLLVVVVLEVRVLVVVGLEFRLTVVVFPVLSVVRTVVRVVPLLLTRDSTEVEGC